MSTPPVDRRRAPRKRELLDALDQHERALTEMIGRWRNGLSARLRAELHALRDPLEALLIRARRRP